MFLQKNLPKRWQNSVSGIVTEPILEEGNVKRGSFLEIRKTLMEVMGARRFAPTRIRATTRMKVSLILHFCRVKAACSVSDFLVVYRNSFRF